jgi:HSP20 family protein
MFSLTRWQPNNHTQVSRQDQSLDPFFGDLLRPFDEMFRELNTPSVLLKSGTAGIAQQMPQVDISESDEALYVTVDVPGYDSKDIDVRVEGDTLRIAGKTNVESGDKSKNRTWHRLERRQQSFERAFTLPATVDPHKTDATCKNGVLTITLPKREDAKPKSISVKVQS